MSLNMQNTKVCMLKYLYTGQTQRQQHRVTLLYVYRHQFYFITKHGVD